MIKIQMGKMIITCDSPAEAGEVLRLQTPGEKREKKYKVKKTFNSSAKKNQWTKSEIKTLMSSVTRGIRAKDVIKDEFLNERHTEQAISFVYYKIKSGGELSDKITKLMKEINVDSGISYKGMSILDVQKKTQQQQVKEYLILDEKN